MAINILAQIGLNLKKSSTTAVVNNITNVKTSVSSLNAVFSNVEQRIESYKGSLRDEVKLREIFSRDAGLPVVYQCAHGEEEHQPEQGGPAHVLEERHHGQERTSRAEHLRPVPKGLRRRQ